MSVWEKVLFVIVAAVFVAKGVDAACWTIAKQEARFRRFVDGGLTRFVVEGGIEFVFVGGLLIAASTSVPYSLAWRTFGVIVAVLVALSLFSARYAQQATPTIEQMPSVADLKKRVFHRRLAGAFMFLLAVVWFATGASLII